MSNFKLPHWVAIVAALAIVVVTWLMNQAANGALVLPAAVLTALTLGKTVLQLFTDSVSGGAGGGGTVVAAKVAPMPGANGPVPPAAARETLRYPARRSGTFRVLAVAGVAAGALMAFGGCGWLNSGGGAVIARQAAATLACELAQVEASPSTPLPDLLACTGGVVSDLVTDIGSLIAYYLSGGPADGGVAASGLACASSSAAPPYPGAPLCLPAGALAALQARHGEAKALAAKAAP